MEGNVSNFIKKRETLFPTLFKGQITSPKSKKQHKKDYTKKYTF